VAASRDFGQAFLRQGYRILLPDLRAHGESGATWQPTACSKETISPVGIVAQRERCALPKIKARVINLGLLALHQQ
jgi:hypothetical protein